MYGSKVHVRVCNLSICTCVHVYGEYPTHISCSSYILHSILYGRHVFFPQTNPLERITVDALMKDSWVQRGYGKSVDWKSRVNVRIILYIFNLLSHTTVSSHRYCYCTDLGSQTI